MRFLFVCWSCRKVDLVERMRYTEEGMRNNIKGNLRGHSIQEPSSTLEQFLTELPEFIAFNLEKKHPMLGEAEDRGMGICAIELFVDIIPTTIFRHYGHRNITLSSFSPEIYILLACKQQSFLSSLSTRPTSSPPATLEPVINREPSNLRKYRT